MKKIISILLTFAIASLTFAMPTLAEEYKATPASLSVNAAEEGIVCYNDENIKIIAGPIQETTEATPVRESRSTRSFTLTWDMYSATTHNHICRLLANVRTVSTNNGWIFANTGIYSWELYDQQIVMAYWKCTDHTDTFIRAEHLFNYEGVRHGPSAVEMYCDKTTGNVTT